MPNDEEQEIETLAHIMAGAYTDVTSGYDDMEIGYARKLARKLHAAGYRRREVDYNLAARVERLEAWARGEAVRI